MVSANYGLFFNFFLLFQLNSIQQNNARKKNPIFSVSVSSNPKLEHVSVKWRRKKPQKRVNGTEKCVVIHTKVSE